MPRPEPMSDFSWDEENHTSNSFSTPSKNPPHDGADSNLLAISHSEVLKGIWVNYKPGVIKAGRARDMDKYLFFFCYKYGPSLRKLERNRVSPKNLGRGKSEEKKRTQGVGCPYLELSLI